MASYRIISSDDHVVEPADLWTTRAEARFRDRAPLITRMPGDTTDWWYCDGVKGMHMGIGSQAGLRFEEPEKLRFAGSFEEQRPGGYIPEEHIKDMDVDGIDVSILYPSVGLTLYSTVPDTELLTSIFRTYNDWIGEYCQPFPDRLKAIGMLNIDVVDDGIKELERCAKMGFAGAMITVYPPEDRSYDSPEYDRLWATAQDLGMPLSLHIGTNRPAPGNEFSDVETIAPSFFANVDHWVRMSLGHLIFSGVFERYPKLMIGSIEMELSWIPHFLDRIDYTYTQRPPGEKYGWHRYEEDMLPSDYFHRNVFLGFQEDGIGIKDRHLIGVDQIMWGSDYPHPETTFPKSQQIIEELLADCTDEEKAKIAGENAAKLYNV